MDVRLDTPPVIVIRLEGRMEVEAATVQRHMLRYEEMWPSPALECPHRRGRGGSELVSICERFRWSRVETGGKVSQQR